MSWYAISTKGELAKEIARAMGKSLDQLDLLDEKRDAQFTVSDIEREMPARVAYGGTDVAAIIDNGDGKIDGSDVLIKQIGYKWETAFVGGCLSKLLKGFETSAWRNPKRITEDVPELAASRGILAEIRKRRITLFADFKKQAEEVFRKVYSGK